MQSVSNQLYLVYDLFLTTYGWNLQKFNFFPLFRGSRSKRPFFFHKANEKLRSSLPITDTFIHLII